MTPPSVSFHLLSSAVCPVAQRAMIALAERGTPVVTEIVPDDAIRQGRQGPAGVLPVLTIRRPGQRDIALTETFAMIELIEDLHPDHPLHPADPAERALHRDLMETGRQVQAHLSAATRAREQNELDMLIHRMRGPLLRAEARLAERIYLPGRKLSNVDVVFGPTLWRLRILDEAHRTFLLSGCRHLKIWAQDILARPALNAVLPDSLRAVYLERVASRGAILADTTHTDAWSELVNRTSRVAGVG